MEKFLLLSDPNSPILQRCPVNTPEEIATAQAFLRDLFKRGVLTDTAVPVYTKAECDCGKTRRLAELFFLSDPALSAQEAEPSDVLSFQEAEPEETPVEWHFVLLPGEKDSLDIPGLRATVKVEKIWGNAVDVTLSLKKVLS